MVSVALACLLLVVITTIVHYEVFRGLSTYLPRLRIRSRVKLLIVMFSTFASHAMHILLFGLAFMVLARYFALGELGGSSVPSITTCLYFSAETYTSLGFGDIVPAGPIRLLAGVETLTGLLLIGWSASYSYLSMERFWHDM